MMHSKINRLKDIRIYPQTFEKLLKSRPRNINNFMNEKGHMKMVRFQICRTPVMKFFELIANIVSFGQFEKDKKKYNFDEIYHLFLIITFENGEIFRLEKNEVVKIRKLTKNIKEIGECEHTIVNDIIFNNVMINLEQQYPNSLYHYTTWEYNCQDFINKFIIESEVNGKFQNFILQNAGELLSVTFKKLSLSATNISAIIQRIMGAGEK